MKETRCKEEQVFYDPIMEKMFITTITELEKIQKRLDNELAPKSFLTLFEVLDILSRDMPEDERNQFLHESKPWGIMSN